jgi:ABC-type glycerol-3-phosphate transport system permease component
MTAWRLKPQLLLYLILGLLLLLTIIPIIWAVFGSFKTNMEIMNHPFALPKTWNFSNYIGAWKLGSFNLYLWNSTVITLGGMIVVVLTACPAGYAFAKLDFRGKEFIFYLILIGMALPVQSIIIPIFYHLKAMGLINTLTGVVLVSSGLALPFSIFLMRNTLKDIPKELQESAYIDGAGEWRTFITIILPLARPGVVALLVFTFMNIWNDFLLPLVLLISNDKFPLSVGLHAFQTETGTEFGYIYGGAVISMIPSIVVYLFFQRHFIEGMSAGAVK